jgi:ADP-heptose:LPS heptosyltransferase
MLATVASDFRAAGLALPFEWFEALERWAQAAVASFRLDIGAQALQLAFDAGASRYPGLFQALRASEAELCARSGQLDRAANIALWYAQRPYLLPERSRLPHIYPRLTAALLLAGCHTDYRLLLWRGLREAYRAPELRDWYATSIRRAYRGYLRALLQSGTRMDDRAQLFAHLVAEGSRRIALSRLLRIDRLLHWATVALGYGLVQRDSRSPIRRRGQAPLSAILVTRAMGGIGDLLMMTPGLRALAAAHPDAEVHLAIPRQYFPLFQGHEDIRCIDIESADLDPARYLGWFNLTDCPASRIESRQAPNVRTGRIEIFARALGLSAHTVRGASARPRYVVLPDEQAAAQMEAQSIRRPGRRLVGLQWHAADSYRDYPHNMELLRLLASRSNVLVFGARQPVDPGLDGVVTVSKPLREAFALAAQCDVLVGPDSSFLHLAGALALPMVLISGPVDGALRAKPYPSVIPMVPSPHDFACAPCWRNENINCYLSRKRESVCLRSIRPDDIAARVDALLLSSASPKGLP